jgi:hypothetical protein
VPPGCLLVSFAERGRLCWLLLLSKREREKERVQSPLASNQSQLSYQQCALAKNPMPFFPALIVRPGGLQEPNLQTAADPE